MHLVRKINFAPAFLKFSLIFSGHCLAHVKYGEQDQLHEQEGWLSPTERASVSAISLRHILASPGYAPGTIAVNVTWMKRGFNACQMHRSMYPSIFNRFPVIQPVSSKDCHFSIFFAHFGLPWVCPWDNCGKCYMDGKRIQCWLNA